MKNEKGFTLIGVIIALALLGVVAVAFFSALSTASKVISITDERATAESLARSQIEYVKNQLYITDLDAGEATYVKISEIPDNYTIWSVNRDGATVEEIIGVPWDTQNNQPTILGTDDGIQKIMVIVKHHGKEVIGLETYKVDR